MRPGRVAEHGQVADAVLVVAERRADDRPGRVVDAADQGQQRTAALEPVVARAVELDQQTRLSHPLATAPVAGWAAPAGARHTRRPEQSLERGAADDDALAVAQELREMTVVDASVSTPGELDDPRPLRLGETARRRSPAVAVDESIDPAREERRSQAPGRALTAGEQPNRLRGCQDARHPASDDLDPLLVPCRQRQPLPHPARLTKSLSSCGCQVH